MSHERSLCAVLRAASRERQLLLRNKCVDYTR